MRVAIDFLASVDGGALTYLLNFPKALAQVDRENTYYLVAGLEHQATLTNLAPNISFVGAPVEGYSVYRRAVWQQFGLPILLRQLGVDVLYSTVNTTSLLAPCKVVLACRITPKVFVAPDALASTFSTRARLGLRWFLMKLSARKASYIITVSHRMKQELTEMLGVSEAKIHVVYHGVGSIFRRTLPDADQLAYWRETHGLRGPFVLSVSTLYRFKNYLNLLRAFYIVRHEYGMNHQLVIIGAVCEPDYTEELRSLITELDMRGEVILIPGVPHDHLPMWYSAADLYVFPSLFESFGFTPLEAMACGVPVAVSRASVMPEIAGEAAFYFDPYDPEDMAQAMCKVLTDSDLRSRLVQMGLRRVKQFSWENTARKTLQVFERCNNQAHELPLNGEEMRH